MVSWIVKWAAGLDWTRVEISTCWPVVGGGVCGFADYGIFHRPFGVRFPCRRVLDEMGSEMVTEVESKVAL